MTERDIFLPKVSLQEIRARNLFFEGGARVQCTIGGDPYNIIFESTNLVEAWWCSLFLTFGAEQVELLLDSPPPLQNILPGIWPSEASTLPEPILLVALNAFLEEALDALSECLGTAITLNTVVVHKKKYVKRQSSLDFSLYDEKTKTRVLCALLFQNEEASLAFSSRLAKLLQHVQDATSVKEYAISLPCHMVVGYTLLSYQDSTDIAVRDIIFFDTYFPTTQSIVIQHNRDWYRGRWEGTSVTLHEHIAEDFDEVSMKHSELDAVPIRIVMDIGSVLVPMKALKNIQQGYVFVTEQNTNSPVNLRIEGKRFGIGELVDVEGRIGVRLVEITMDKEEVEHAPLLDVGGNSYSETMEVAEHDTEYSNEAEEVEDENVLAEDTVFYDEDAQAMMDEEDTMA